MSRREMRVLCGLLALGGCSLETAGLRTVDSLANGSGLAPSDAQAPPTDASQDAPEALPDSAADSAADATDTGCDLNGRRALQVQADVTWDAKTLLGFVPVIDAGRGSLTMTVLVDYDQQGNVLEGSLRACNAVIPSFVSGTLGERYLTYFDEAVWDAPEMPTTPVRVQLGCTTPGCTLDVEPVHVLLGMKSDTPAAPWPADRNAIDYEDHDGDGIPGIAVTAYGPNDPPGIYDYPPVTADFIRMYRARKLMLGLRVSAVLSGKLDSCEQFSGMATQLSVDTHAVACVVASPSSVCTAQQSGFLDDNLPQWVTESATFRAVEVADDASCADARAAIRNLGP